MSNFVCFEPAVLGPSFCVIFNFLISKFKKSDYDIEVLSMMQKLQPTTAGMQHTKIGQVHGVIVTLSFYLGEQEQCPLLDPPNNGEVNCSDGNEPGSICTFRCVKGTYMAGPSRITCGRDRTWDGEAPSCRSKTPKYNRYLKLGAISLLSI